MLTIEEKPNGAKQKDPEDVAKNWNSDCKATSHQNIETVYTLQGFISPFYLHCLIYLHTFLQLGFYSWKEKSLGKENVKFV